MKITFPHGGKQEISKKRISPARENQKLAEDTFPKLGKRENVENRNSQTWEEQKNGRKWLSQHWEDRKTAKKCFPKLGKNKKSQRLHFPTLGRKKIPLRAFPIPWTSDFFYFRSSNSLDGRFFSFFVHPTPWTSSFSCFSFIRVLGRAVFPIFHSSESSDG